MIIDQYKKMKNLFLRQSYIDAWEDYQRSIRKRSFAQWDYIVLTASNEEQANAFQSQITYRQNKNVLPCKTKYLVLPDPDGKRVGSGGATLQVLRKLAEQEDIAGDFHNKRILVIHSGGDSKRVPQYSVCGKLFSPVPRELPDGRASTLFDEFLIGMAGVPSRFREGMLVLSGDVLLLFNPLQIDAQFHGAAAISMKSPVDADYVEAFVGLLEILGLRDEEIICSSVPPYCIPLGNKVYEWLVNEFQNSDLHVIYAFSKDYYSSAASLNEMGAAWAMKHKWTGVLLPGFQFNQLDGCIDKTQIAIKLDDSDNRTLKFRLSEFKDELTKEFNLRPMSEATWERQRDGFLDRISTITEARAKECKNTDESDQQHMPTVGQDDVGRIPVEPAFLLVYAAEGNGQIFRLATLGSAVQVSTDGKQFMADNSQRESARWQEALDLLITWGWVKPVGRKGEVYEVTGTGYTKADWLKAGMCIDTSKEPLEELKQFEF